MAQHKSDSPDFTRILRRIFVGIVLALMLGLFLLWRIDNPRAERLRMAIVDRFVPSFDFVFTPLNGVASMIGDFQSYTRIYQQNQELRRELQRMKAWREAALQLEQKNARLLELNNLKLSPQLTYISGEVLADAGSPFRQSTLINIGRNDGLSDGWAAMDGLGLVGRIAGLGENTARVLLLTDTQSQIPVVIKPSDQKAILTGDNTPVPILNFVENPKTISPGDRVVTAGDGGVFPAGLLAGQVVLDANGRLRIRLAADYKRLEFLRILRHTPPAPLNDPSVVFGPKLPTNTQ